MNLVPLLVSLVLAAPFQPPPAPTRFVTDGADFLSQSTEQLLEARLSAYQQQSGRQVIVWIGRSIDEGSIEEWAARTFEAWGIGRRGKDDGVGIFVFAESRAVRIEVGYGLEQTLTDALAARIIAEQFVPRARAGDPDGAITGTVDAVLSTLGATGGPPVGARELQPPTVWRLGFYSILGVLMLILMITHPRLALLLLWSVVGRGHSGPGLGSRGGFGGGGFGGGGGRSGGGGASGSW